MPTFARITFAVELTGATAQALSATALSAEEVTVVAQSDNDAAVYLGASTVTADNGIELVPTASYHSSKPVSLNDLYIIGTSGDIVRVIATVRA